MANGAEELMSFSPHPKDTQEELCWLYSITFDQMEL